MAGGCLLAGEAERCFIGASGVEARCLTAGEAGRFTAGEAGRRSGVAARGFTWHLVDASGVADRGFASCLSPGLFAAGEVDLDERSAVRRTGEAGRGDTVPEVRLAGDAGRCCTAGAVLRLGGVAGRFGTAARLAGEGVLLNGFATAVLAFRSVSPFEGFAARGEIALPTTTRPEASGSTVVSAAVAVAVAEGSLESDSGLTAVLSSFG